jgi:hypothetical protein
VTTAKDIIDEVSAQLHGWGSTSDRITPLTANIGPTDTQFTVDFSFGQSVGITPGVVEIDSEQLYVTSVDPTSGVCVLANGFGRGYADTTAASHTAGAKVVSRPKFPRVWLMRQVNETIGAVFPQLFAVNTFTGVVTYPNNTYTLPTVPQMILDAQWQDPVGRWVRCPSYAIDPFDGSFRLGSGALIGRPLRVLYATEPQPFANETDVFTTTTGLPASCVDVLTLGTVAQQVPGLDISRAQTSSVEQSNRSAVVAPGAGVSAAKFLMAEYQQRLHNEAQSLRKLYKSRLVKTF